MSTMSGNGLCKLRNSEDGATWVGEAKLIWRFCFALEILGSAKHSSGNKEYRPDKEESEPILIGCDDSSLVVDSLCDQTRGQRAATTCFYFDFAARKEQTAACMLGSLLRQMVGGMERIPEEIWRAFQERRKDIGGCGPQLVDVMKMLQLITSSQHTFIVIDALDECMAVQRLRLLGLLKKILDKSPGTRVFVTGRPHIGDEIEQRLAGQVVSVSVTPRKADIITYLRVRLSEDVTPEAMDASLEEDILDKIPENIPEMCVVGWC